MGRNEEEKIQEEVRRRVLARAEERQQAEVLKDMQEANVEALSEVVDLSLDEIEAIDRQVRLETEQETTTGGSKTILLTGFVGLLLIVCGALVYWMFYQQGTEPEIAQSAKPLPTPQENTQRIAPPSKPPTPVATLPLQPPEPPITKPSTESSGDKNWIVVSHSEAKKVLTTQFMSCMKEFNIYNFWIRLGAGEYNAKKTGPLPPLMTRYMVTINYQDADLNASQFGGCVTGAMAGIRTRAYGGNYLYFNIDNKSAPDPLSGAPKKLDSREATKRLSAVDGEARDCAERYPEQAQPGATLIFGIHFRGFTGKVTKVNPVYIGADSDYSKCLQNTYSQVAVPRFRDYEGKVTYTLAP